ncbi:uncharacterized protein LOC105435964 [Cucumis sativus]|uniref:Uncharacterized protein n=1 Tax=Cucumis sativus TaxID=3659 RepID=A0A0A0KNE6_CUCSA|nr:uncharacterized protein LOC105435964 [Cucumis sativus]KGN49251.1 hypothetical protein Csa_003245 [Cucumis sativus]
MFNQSDHQDLLNGWPLGLQVMNSTLRLMADSGTHTLPSAQPSPNLLIPSFSFSSLSSSELDTLSTASFFQDPSVSLGRLIGLKPADKTWLYFPTEEKKSVSANSAGRRVDDSKTKNAGEHEIISGRICIPIVIGVILKMIRSRRNSRKCSVG